MIKISGLEEEDFMAFRWYAEVNTVRRKTGEYRILNNSGSSIGEMTKGIRGWDIYLFENNYRGFYAQSDKEIQKVKEIAQKVIKKELKMIYPWEEKKEESKQNIYYFPRTQRTFRETRFQQRTYYGKTSGFY